MSKYAATVRWTRQPNEAFVDRRYSRAHLWIFDGGAEVPASSSPSVVRIPLSDPAGVDSEEALLASVSSCHMLFFLDSPVGRSSSSSPTRTRSKGSCRRARTAGPG